MRVGRDRKIKVPSVGVNDYLELGWYHMKDLEGEWLCWSFAMGSPVYPDDPEAKPHEQEVGKGHWH